MKKTRILIIGDDLFSEKAVSVLLDEGYETISVGTTEEGFNVMTGKGIEIILFELINDSDLADLDRLRRRRKDSPVIIITDLSMADKAIDAVSQWTFSYLLDSSHTRLLPHILRSIEKQISGKKAEGGDRSTEDPMQEQTKHLQLAKQKAEAESLAKSELLEEMVRQIKSPIVIIAGSAVVLLEELCGQLNEKQREHVNRILYNVRSLEKIINGKRSQKFKENTE